MKALILAGGEQTRIGFSAETKPKSLLITRENDTILLNLLKQLDIQEISEIVIYPGDNKLIEKYLKKIGNKIKTKISIDKTKLPKLGHYVFAYKDAESVTFVFGDMYVPEPQLTQYIKAANSGINDYFAFIAVSDTQVGDYKVELRDDYVNKISKENGQKFTCGLFSILNQKIIPKLKQTDKMTEVFAQIPEINLKTGYFEINGAIDIDTPDSLSQI